MIKICMSWLGLIVLFCFFLQRDKVREQQHDPRPSYIRQIYPLSPAPKKNKTNKSKKKKKKKEKLKNYKW